MRELALHLLDLAQNSIAAGARHLRIEVRLDRRLDRLAIEVADDGRGIKPEDLAKVTDPFFTSRTTRHVGLGLPLCQAAAERCGGGLTVVSEPGRGTVVRAEFGLRHVDRAPLGDLAGTLLTLIACNPQLDLELTARWGEERFTFSAAVCREMLGSETSLSDPAVLAFLRDYLSAGLAGLERADSEAAGLQMDRMA